VLCPAIPCDAAVVEDLLKLGCGGRALSRGQIGVSANVNGRQARHVTQELHIPILNRRRRRIEGLENTAFPTGPARPHGMASK